MNGVNNKYNIEIEVLTPLSIGAGAEKDWVRGVDFVVDNSRLYKLNLKKLVAKGVKIDALTTYFAKKDESGIKSQIAGRLEEVSDFSMPFPAETDNDIKTFVRNQLTGNPVLSGSSLKGAIRSILFNYLGGDSKDGKEIFGSPVKGDEFMRFIKVSDAEFDETELVNTKIFNLQGGGNNWRGGWKKEQSKTENNFSAIGFNTVYECIAPEYKAFATIMTSEMQFGKMKHVKEVAKHDILHNGISKLFSIINNHTKEYLKKERRFFEKYSTDKTDDIIESIDNLLNQIPENNSYCILKMSAGSGFHSITGDWQFKNFTDGKFDRKRADKKDLFAIGKVLPKSRKIAICNGTLSLMGFVKLRPVSDEEIKKAEEERIYKLQHAEEIRQAQLAAEKLRQAQELQAAKEHEEQVAKYKSLIEKATILYNEDNINEAKTLCDEAERMFPQMTSHLSLKTMIEGKLHQIEFENQQKVKAEVEQQERAAKNAISLKDKITNATRIGTLCGNVETWLKYGNKFSDEDKSAFFDKLKEISQTLKSKDLKAFKDFKSWKKIVDLFGEDVAKEWFDKLTK